MADHVQILRIYLAHLRCKTPTQSTRPRWCDVHAALEEAIRVMSEPAPQPPAVGVDVSEEMSAAWRECYSATIKALAVMVTAGAPEELDRCEVVNRDQINSQVIKIREAIDGFNKPFLTAALRTGGGA